MSNTDRDLIAKLADGLTRQSYIYVACGVTDASRQRARLPFLLPSPTAPSGAAA